MATGIKVLETKEARAKGGRASGGTRYFTGKRSGENTIVRLMQRAIDEKKKSVVTSKNEEIAAKIDSLLALMADSERQTEEMLDRLRKQLCSKI